MTTYEDEAGSPSERGMDDATDSPHSPPLQVRLRVDNDHVRETTRVTVRCPVYGTPQVQMRKRLRDGARRSGSCRTGRDVGPANRAWVGWSPDGGLLLLIKYLSVLAEVGDHNQAAGETAAAGSIAAVYSHQLVEAGEAAFAAA